MKCLMVGKYCVLNIIRIKMLHIVVTSEYQKIDGCACICPLFTDLVTCKDALVKL